MLPHHFSETASFFILSFQSYRQHDGVVVGVFKAEVNGLNAHCLHIRGHDEAVDDIVLGVYLVAFVIGLIEQAAGRNAQVVLELKALRQQVVIKLSGQPLLLMGVRVSLKRAGEALVKVSAGDDVVALTVLALYKLTKLLCLC